MKTLIASALVLGSLNTFAASIPVYEGSAYDQIDASFGINEEMNRAWVELAVYTGSGDSMSVSWERTKVEGLSTVGGSVVLDVDGQQVECAKIKTTRVFHNRVPRATGNCMFVSKVERRTIDDGFETHTRKVQVITLVTK